MAKSTLELSTQQHLQIDSAPSSFTSNYSSSVIYAFEDDTEQTPAGPAAPEVVGGPHVLDQPLFGSSSSLRSIFRKLKRRSKRPAKYPVPVDQLFAQLELGKVFTSSMVGMLAAIGSYHQYGLISEELMHLVLLLLAFSLMLIISALTLKDMVPEVAVAAMLAGVSSTVGCFHTIIVASLPVNKRFLVNFLALPSYICLLLVYLYKIIKKDVREEEKIEVHGRPAGTDPSVLIK